jgi:peptide/nickel transport system permease protein
MTTGVVAALFRRIAAATVVALIVVSITFVVVRLLPGNPAYLLAGSTANAQTIKTLDHQLGLDRPVYTQYWIYLRQAVSLNFGTSILTGDQVSYDLRKKIPATFELTLAGLFIGSIAGVTLGVITAIRGSGILARAASLLSVAGAAIPEFWFGLILILVFYVYLGVAPEPVGRLSDTIMSPPSGPTGLYTVDGVLHWRWDVVESALAHLALPAIALGFLALPSVARVTRATMRTVLAEDFVVTARANGDRGLRLYLLRVLPVAAPPIVTAMGLLSGYLLAGDFLLEKIFGWPGVGLYTIDAVQNGDYAVVEAAVLLAALVYVLIFFLVDVVNTVIDPRMRAHTS